ncbi:MAG TPA: hypothetical protein VLE43_00840 [Candidatus Saccharimonadia bacterium]|nr:hypothetical protein [Candidatus Saccharimonadia bacterium]
MNIPRFWASAEDHADTTVGQGTPLKCYGWSDHDIAEAKVRAAEALARLLERVRQGAPFPGKYVYADRPIREEILEEMHDASGQLQGLITRNAYGAAVLNTNGVMFVDIDDENPDTASESSGPADDVISRLLGWFTRREPVAQVQPAYRPTPPNEHGVPEPVAAFARANPDWSLRCYRTFAGWRLLVTHATFDPVSDQVREILTAFESDRKYIELTRVQQCFRARLTPKPWRCDIPRPIRAFPRESTSLQRAHAQWLTEYERACARFATCRYVTTLGSGDACPAAEIAVLWHDRVTKANESLPLA